MNTTLILVEGTDGTGKSQFIKHLSKHLTEQTQPAQLRTLAFPTKPIPNQNHPSSEVLFFLNDFNTTFQNLPDFSAEGEGIILCDRSFLTTIVYQGFRGDYSLVKGRFYNSIMNVGETTFLGHINFDTVHTVLLTCSIETAQSRIGQRGVDKDDLDKMEGSQQHMRLETLAYRYRIVTSDLKTRWNKTQPFRPDPVENSETYFHEISTEKKSSKALAKAFFDSAIRD